MTRTTRARVRNSVNRTSASDARIDSERSERSWRSTEAGKNCLRLAMTVRTRPATSTVFAPGCRCTASTIARLPLNQAALLLSCTSSSTRPMSPSRTGAPLRYATTSGRNASASSSCPFAWTVKARCGPHRMPVGRFTLPAATAFETSSMPRERDASALGSSWMRTAYLAAPYTLTCATPSIVDRRCAMNVSAYSSRSGNDSVAELMA